MSEKYFELRGKKIELPLFLPDATKARVKGVSVRDLEDCKIDGVVVNIYHLLKEGLIEEIKRKGGIHKYMDFSGIVISDSGGFQVMSLIHDLKQGEMFDDKAVFTLDGKKIVLTPELCVRLQLDIGSDIVMCLDDCTRPEASIEQQEKSIERTVNWARRCKEEFIRLTRNMSNKPLLFGIIQGGNNFQLRKKCADALKEIGFDGYAFGGFPVGDNGEGFLSELLKYTCSLMPANQPRYAMGIGKPENIVECVEMGYDMFDCVIPTREARNNRLYGFKARFLGIGIKPLDSKGEFYEYIRIRSESNSHNSKSISNLCDCHACTLYSRADIYKLFKDKSSESIRLATMHNLRFYSMLMERLRKKN